MSSIKTIDIYQRNIGDHMNWKFQNKHLQECRWSKDPRKRYNQLKHYWENAKKYDIGIADLIAVSDFKKDAYYEYSKKKK